MKEKEIFGLIIRITGMLLAVYGICTAYSWLYSTPVSHALLFGVPYVAVAVYLLRGAPHLIRFSYPEQQKTDVNQQSTQNKQAEPGSSA